MGGAIGMRWFWIGNVEKHSRVRAGRLSSRPAVMHWPNMDFLGGKHRPDFTVNIEDLDIAVEIKLGSDGSSIRDGIGQSLVYEMHYDFVVYLLIDQSADSTIVNSLNSNLEKSLFASLWDNYNIRLVVR